jgi:hypothetical protein
MVPYTLEQIRYTHQVAGSLIDSAMRSRCDLQTQIGYRKGKCTKSVPDQRVDAEQDIAAPWKNSQALCAIAPSIETESLAPVSTLQQDNVPPPVPSVNF